MTEDIGEHRKSVRLSNLPNYWSLVFFFSILAFSELTCNFPLLNQNYFIFIYLFIFSTHLMIFKHFFQPTVFSQLFFSSLSLSVTWHVLTNHSREREFSTVWTVKVFYKFTLNIDSTLFFLPIFQSCTIDT